MNFCLVKERKLKEQVENGKHFIELLTACIDGPIHALTPDLQSSVKVEFVFIYHFQRF